MLRLALAGDCDSEGISRKGLSYLPGVVDTLADELPGGPGEPRPRRQAMSWAFGHQLAAGVTKRTHSKWCASSCAKR